MTWATRFRLRESVRHSLWLVPLLGALAGALLAWTAAVGAVNHDTAAGGILAAVLFAFVLGALWLVVSMHLPHADARWTDLIPGSLFYAVGVFLVVLFNILILDRLLEEKSSTYGALGIAATLLLGFFLIGRVIVGAAVLNATLHNRHRGVARSAPWSDERSSGSAPVDRRNVRGGVRVHGR